jgi:hypothetical protein
MRLLGEFGETLRLHKQKRQYRAKPSGKDRMEGVTTRLLSPNNNTAQERPVY